MLNVGGGEDIKGSDLFIVQCKRDRADLIPLGHRRGDAFFDGDGTLDFVLLPFRQGQGRRIVTDNLYLILHAALHGDGIKILRKTEIDGLEIRKAEVEQSRGVFETCGTAVCAENNADQTDAVSLGGSGDTGAGVAGRTRFQARDAFVGTQQFIGVDDLGLAAAQAVEPYRDRYNF